MIPSGVSRSRKEAFMAQESENINDQNNKTDEEKSGKQGIFRHPCESSHQSAEEKTSAYRKMLKARGAAKKKK